MAITPDDKDWTWVLERPCPDCEFDARAIDVDATPLLLRDLAGSWRDVLGRDDVDQRPAPDKWSPLEYACHVRDVFRLFDTRLQLMLANDGARFENWDQDKTAIEDRYDLQDPGDVSEQLVAASEVLADHFALVEGPLWAHRGIRSNGSEFTVTTFALYLLHDPIHHLWDVRVG